MDLEKIVGQFCREIVMASHLYYSGNQEIQSPLSDSEYDARVLFVCSNWTLTPLSFRKRITKEELSASGHTLKATASERKNAEKWALNDK